MSSPTKRVHLIVERQTELLFCRDVLAPYMGEKGIILTTSLISKPGSNGGNVRFSRARRDILNHLREKSAPIVSTMVDYSSDATGGSQARFRNPCVKWVRRIFRCVCPEMTV